MLNVSRIWPRGLQDPFWKAQEALQRLPRCLKRPLGRLLRLRLFWGPHCEPTWPPHVPLKTSIINSHHRKKTMKIYVSANFVFFNSRRLLSSVRKPLGPPLVGILAPKALTPSMRAPRGLQERSRRPPRAPFRPLEALSGIL